MARIRTIKPEILTDEKTAALSDTEWRLFVSCIAMADDYGNFRASPAFIHSQAFWSSSTTREDSRKALENVASVSLIKLYVVEGQQYGHITGWEKHQRVDHPGKPLCPFPTDSRASRESSRNSREEIAQVSDITSSRDSRETLAPEGEKEEEKEVGIGKGGDAPARVATGGPIRPRTAHDLEHCLRVAIEREQPKNGPWNPGGSFAAKEAREFLEGFKSPYRNEPARIVACAINYEDGALLCSHSGKPIPSAYGEEETGE